jgi:hypothetical protein
MFGLFGKSRFLDADVEDWCLETWGWLMTNLGGMGRLSRTPLALPSREFFPPTEAEGHALALYVFGRIKTLMAIDDWPCELESYDRPEDGQRVGYYAKLQRGKSANGTFRIEEGKVIISYASDLLAQPRQLIATLAHELAHYLLATIRKPIPGGNELHELATELTVAFAGFGVFGANAAFSFQQHQDAFGQGWSSGRSGYFSEPTWSFALALFADLKGIEIPKDSLKDSVAHLTRRASRYLKRHESLSAPLRSIA